MTLIISENSKPALLRKLGVVRMLFKKLYGASNIYSICISYFVVTKELLLNFDPIECIQKRDLTAASLVCDVSFVLL